MLTASGLPGVRPPERRRRPASGSAVAPAHAASGGRVRGQPSIGARHRELRARSGAALDRRRAAFDQVQVVEDLPWKELTEEGCRHLVHEHADVSARLGALDG